MAWSPVSMGLSQGKEEGSMLFAKPSIRGKYSSLSWTEDETVAANKEVIVLNVLKHELF